MSFVVVGGPVPCKKKIEHTMHHPLLKKKKHTVRLACLGSLMVLRLIMPYLFFFSLFFHT
jgi:hypothetical protein